MDMAARKIDDRNSISAISENCSASLSDIFRDQRIETLPAGAAAFREGDKAAHVFEIIEGVIRAFKLLADGRRVITAFLYPGDLMGVSLEEYPYTAEAVNKVKIRRIMRAKFDAQVATSADLQPLLLARLCSDMTAAQDQMVLLARKTAEERVSTHLIRALQRHEKKSGAAAAHAEIPMTRADMADYLGLTLETVSRIMGSLVARGVIAQTGRHGFEIRKGAMLAALAGERGLAPPPSSGKLNYRSIKRPAHSETVASEAL